METRLGSKMGKMVAVGSMAMAAVEDVFQKLFCFYLQSHPGTTRPGRGHRLPPAHTHSTGSGAHKVVKSQLSVS